MTPAPAADRRPGAPDATDPAVIHASAVGHCGRGCLILGAAGSGKTALALAMLALGAELIADDRVAVRDSADGPRLDPVPHLAGLIEIRGAGILRLRRHASDVPLWLAADLDREAPARMPPRTHARVADHDIPAIACRGWAGAAAGLMAILSAGVLPDPEFFPTGGLR
ncbi:serine kinase [Limibaculum sp. FT325]|uniref:serine kinase n=1 Tax=Thermohalobaculum sediminis TaxID=2939436 RepID=UPI0020C12BBF|nr:serine kinase [Limibaculum sediminis]MCL5777614.1 serine kinase [Limibaculum sediminis]